MAYENYLIKAGNYVIDEERFIFYKTYKFKREPLDDGSKRLMAGKLRRKVLSHVPLHVSFSTPPMLTASDVEELFKNIEKNIIGDINEGKILITAYNPRKNAYSSQEMYLVEPDFSIYTTKNGIVKHDSIVIEFIGY